MTATATQTKPRTRAKAVVVTIGQRIDALADLKAQYKEASAAADAIKEKITAAEEALIAELEGQGIDKAAGTKGSITRRPSTVATVKDWDLFWAYVYKNKLGHLLQRRVSDPAVREIFETKGQVPGIELYTKVALGFSAAK